MILNGSSGCGPFDEATFCAQPVPAHVTAIRRPPSASAALLDGRLDLILLAHVAGDELDRRARRRAPRRDPSLTSAIVTAAPLSCSRADGRLAEARRAADDERPCVADVHARQPDGASRSDGGDTSRRAPGQREQLVVVGEQPSLELEPGRGEVALRAARGVNFALISVRSSSRGVELDVEAERADAHVLARRGAQAHLDPLALAVEERDVLERVDVEVGVELAVEDVQDVAVELGRHALRCRRRRPRARAGSLTRSVPSSRWSSGPSAFASPRRKRRRLPGVKLPIVPPRKRDEARAERLGQVVAGGARSRRRCRGRAGPGTPRPAPRRSRGPSARSRRAGRSGAACRRPASRRAGRASWPRCPSRARRSRPRRCSSTISLGACLEDRALGARRVVLGQVADAVEQLRAAGVVEVLGRQLLERAREPVEHVVGQRALVGRGRGRLSDLDASSTGPAPSGSSSRQPHAGEDLPPLGEVPVAERGRGDARVRRPTSRRAGRGSRRRRRPRSTRGRGARRSPG